MLRSSYWHGHLLPKGLFKLYQETFRMNQNGGQTINHLSDVSNILQLFSFWIGLVCCLLSLSQKELT